MSAVHVLRHLRHGAVPSRAGRVPSGRAAMVSVVALAALAVPLFAGPAAALPDRASPPVVTDLPLIPAQAGGPAVSPHQEPAPNLFDATGTALWDGKRTLQGVWVAHPLATSARRVRIYNTQTGAAVDGALFKRDPALTGPSVLVSSEAAQFLGMSPGEETDLRIVALTPSQRPQGATSTEPPPAAEPAASDPAPRAEPASAAAPAPSEAGTRAEAGPEPENAAGAEPALTTAAIPAPRPAQPETAAAPSPSLPPPGGAPATGSLPEPKAEAAATPAQPVFQPAPGAAGGASSGVAVLPAPDRTASDPTPAPDRTAAVTEPLDLVPAPDTAPEPASAPDAGTAPGPAPSSGPAEAAAKPARTASAPKAESRLSRPFVQAGIFGVAENADRLISRLKAANLPAVGKPITLNGRAMTRVLAGPFASSEQRDAALRTIRGMGLKDAAPAAR